MYSRVMRGLLVFVVLMGAVSSANAGFADAYLHPEWVNLGDIVMTNGQISILMKYQRVKGLYQTMNVIVDDYPVKTIGSRVEPGTKTHPAECANGIGFCTYADNGGYFQYYVNADLSTLRGSHTIQLEMCYSNPVNGGCIVSIPYTLDVNTVTINGKAASTAYLGCGKWSTGISYPKGSFAYQELGYNELATMYRAEADVPVSSLEHWVDGNWGPSIVYPPNVEVWYHGRIYKSRIEAPRVNPENDTTGTWINLGACK